MDFQLYRIWFDDPQGNRRSTDTTKGVWIAKDGFWVDEDWQRTTTFDDCIHWIPPHRIVLMTKLRGQRSESDG
jgi:hypothetical protein